ncbi:CehA/McbA family metallohydrolase [bacterium]|nr:CehA/McbA family metallohydrolase [bacterium]
MIDPTNINIPDLIPLIGLYAETHYRFRGFPFSRYFRREPEVIFDAPFRLEPNHNLPITMIIKDAHHFPVKLESIDIRISNGEKSQSLNIPLNLWINKSLWHCVSDVDVSDFPPGLVKIEATAHLQDKKRTWDVSQDNYHGLSQAPLEVFLAAEPLPKLPGWYAGELHTHTEYGCDQVEFGAPLEAIKSTADALGLDWVSLTDHSYNLDDMIDDYLHDDPQLLKWHGFLSHVKRLNKMPGSVVLVPGEELTCRASNGKNVHMLVLGEQRFLQGTGDSAQEWFQTRSQFTVRHAIAALSENSVTIAAHPFSPVPFLQKHLVNRSIWQDSDLSASGLSGWQILNGNPEKDFYLGLEKWITALLKGERRYIYAGNDAHGNFNRFRQVKMPMLSLHEHDNFIFGKSTTHVYINETPTVQNVLKALELGRTVISSGPVLELTVLNQSKKFLSGDETLSDPNSLIRVTCQSSEEFGCIERIIVNTYNSGDEKSIFQVNFDVNNNEPIYYKGIEFQLQGELYLRAEIHTRLHNGSTRFAYSNPIWLKTGK